MGTILVQQIMGFGVTLVIHQPGILKFFIRKIKIISKKKKNSPILLSPTVTITGPLPQLLKILGVLSQQVNSGLATSPSGNSPLATPRRYPDRPHCSTTHPWRRKHRCFRWGYPWDILGISLAFDVYLTCCDMALMALMALMGLMLMLRCTSFLVTPFVSMFEANSSIHPSLYAIWRWSFTYSNLVTAITSHLKICLFGFVFMIS